MPASARLISTERTSFLLPQDKLFSLIEKIVAAVKPLYQTFSEDKIEDTKGREMTYRKRG